MDDVHGETIASFYPTGSPPETLKLQTTRGRDWVVDPMALGGKTWIIGAAAVPAAVATLLLSLGYFADCPRTGLGHSKVVKNLVINVVKRSNKRSKNIVKYYLSI